MTSNRPGKENQLGLFCTEEPCVCNAPELQKEESVAAAMERPALSTTTENLMERIVDQAAWRRLGGTSQQTAEPQAPTA